ncbi:MAG TPA: hypothetical protein VGV87_09530 [Blastocatellia bacterium]|jgi:hypothetical protein|nr:hypothetical protein [Blastocatellia bacterium]
MCQRNTDDPLLRIFLDQYGLHLLSVPRQNAAVGDLYVHDGKRATPSGGIQHFVDAAFKRPPVASDETMADVLGKISRGVDFKVGFGLLDGFLNALGAAGIVNKVRVGFEARKTQALKFRFTEAVRDSMDVMQLGKNLINRKIVKNHALFDEDYNYYVVTAVARSSSISVIGETEAEKSVNGALEAMHLGNVDGGVSIKTSGEGEVTFSGNKKLAFGVQLYELKYDANRKALRLKLPPDAVRVMKAEEAIEGRKGIDLVKPAFIGGPEGNVFLDVKG